MNRRLLIDENTNKMLDEILMMKALQVMVNAGVKPKDRFVALSYDFPAFRDEMGWMAKPILFGRPRRISIIQDDSAINHFSPGFCEEMDTLEISGIFNSEAYSSSVSRLEKKLGEHERGISPHINREGKSELFEIMMFLFEKKKPDAYSSIDNWLSKGRITRHQAGALKEIYSAHNKKRESVAKGMRDHRVFFLPYEAALIDICERSGNLSEGFGVLLTLEKYNGQRDVKEAIIFYNSLHAMMQTKFKSGKRKNQNRFDYKEMFESLMRVFPHFPSDFVLKDMYERLSSRDPYAKRTRDDNLRGRADIYEPLADAMRHNSRYFPAFVVAAVSSAEEKDWAATSKEAHKEAHSTEVSRRDINPTSICRDKTSQTLRFVRQYYELMYKYGM